MLCHGGKYLSAILKGAKNPYTGCTHIDNESIDERHERHGKDS